MSKRRRHRTCPAFDWLRMDCPACMGVGIAQVDDDGWTRYTECGRCDGTGRVTVRRSEIDGAAKAIHMRTAHP